MNQKQSRSMPKYMTVMTSLIDRINAGEFAPNYMLPPESELIDSYRVSRITIRKALDEMESQGYIVRKQGKGTYVNQSHVDETIYKKYNAGYSGVINSTGAACERKQILKEIRPAGGCGKALELGADDPALFYYRSYLADGIPVFYAESCVNHRIFQGIENYDFVFVPLSYLVRSVYEGQLYRRDRKIQSTKAGPVAAYLGIDESDPILRLAYTSVVNVDNEMIPFESAIIYVRTDVIEIDPEYL